MNMAVISNILSSIVVAMILVVALVVFDAPLWACVGLGLMTYLQQVRP